ncbi:family 43 glycosylhydrolase [Zunongwangia pacifica]|uniref:Family 43 glycosylhydrolase n=1 Tax=Zunongwangia pacifica TaxID=2911062 RepID=A0A9X1ZPT3_9FLAO|nr:family 43 glycosylhydrolase [Zunongwangia pacifica]MCL6217881.1 family 43 glycosylhydrolase [Zunongwangia pacifica]
MRIDFLKNYYTFLLVFLLFFLNVNAQNKTIHNDQFWETIDGQPIYSQGGGIFKFKDPKTGELKYYWYGAYYKEAELYRNDPSQTYTQDHFVAVTCYSSSDLINWTFEDHVFERTEALKHDQGTRWMGRLGVLYIPEMKKYAMLIQHNAGVLIALSDSPTGTFKWHRKLDMTDRIGTPNTGDQSVFTDYELGKSYLVYSYGQGRNKIYLSEIGVKNGEVDLLDCTEIFRGKGREGNCMFKYNGKYYVFASNLYGWDSSYAYYLVSDHIKGPYLPTNNMLVTPGSIDDYAHITQTGFFVNVKGGETETVIYCGDRWSNFAGNGLGYNQWVPLSFQEEVPYFNSLNSWMLDENTGVWQVSEDNNYIKNPSFEADRKAIPSSVKPIQEQLKGWIAKVYQGNTIVIGQKESPQLNYFNTTEDRKYVIGEKSLNIEDNVAFERQVYQIVTSTPFVDLKDGRYTLMAKVKSNSRFKNLEMYADSAGLQQKAVISDNDGDWHTVIIENIIIKKAKVEIGFYAKGSPGASAQIDDVSLIKMK